MQMTIEFLQNCDQESGWKINQLHLEFRAAGTYKDTRTGPHHVFSIELGKNQNSTFDRVLLEFY